MGNLCRWAGLLAATALLSLAAGCKSAPAVGDAPPKAASTAKSEARPVPPDECVFPNGLTLTQPDQISRFAKQSCSAIEGDLTISGPEVRHLTALFELTEIRGSLRIVDPEQLRDAQGLESLARIDGDLIVTRNKTLTDLSDLYGLRRLGGSLKVQSNPQLEALPRLKIYDPPIHGDVAIADNPKLESLAGLECIWRIDGDLRLQGLPIANLDSILPLVQIGGSLTLIDLPNLRRLYLTSFQIQGPLIVSGQLGFLPDCEFERWKRLPAQDVAPRETFVDASQTTYIVEGKDDLNYLEELGCEETSASVIVVGVSTKDLRALRHLRSIRGDLIIRSNAQLVSLAGLETLEHVGGDFLISHNPKLSSLAQLTSLRRVDGQLRIEKLVKLGSIDGFGRLTMIGKGLTISQNDRLDTIQAFERLRTIRGDMLIDSNWMLQSVSRLDPKVITGNVRIVHNPLLSSLGTLGSRARVMGRVDVYPSAHIPEKQLLRLQQEMATTESDGE